MSDKPKRHCMSWTEEEKEIAKKYPPKEAKKHLERTYAAIRRKQYELGVSWITRWSDDEIDLLKRIYLTHTTDECVEIFTKNGYNRGRYSINNKASDLGLIRRVPNRYVDQGDGTTIIKMGDKHGFGRAETLVDTKFVDRLSETAWAIQVSREGHTYVQACPDQPTTKLLHRHILEDLVGLSLKDKTILHIDGDNLNNTLANMEARRRSDTNQLDVGRRPHAKYDLPRGVTMTKSSTYPYRAQFGYRGDVLRLGDYEEPEQAQSAYRVARLMLNDLFREGSRHHTKPPQKLGQRAQERLTKTVKPLMDEDTFDALLKKYKKP